MDCAVVELRQYTLHPGARETLIELFDREFVHTQEAVGIRVLGQFRDLDDPDRFVWLRGFPDMESRRASLEAFYGGPVWAVHREAANATMIDSDDVLLLRPKPGSLCGAPSGLTELGGYVIVVAPVAPVAPVGTADDARVGASFGDGVRLATFVTESAANTFPALPVRLGETVVVDVHWLGATAFRRALSDASATSPGSKILRLSPTSGSALR